MQSSRQSSSSCSSSQVIARGASAQALLTTYSYATASRLDCTCVAAHSSPSISVDSLLICLLVTQLHLTSKNTLHTTKSRQVQAVNNKQQH
jgi:hypothetical protein